MIIRRCDTDPGCPLVSPGRHNGVVIRDGQRETSCFGLLAGETIEVERATGVLTKWIGDGRVVVVDLSVGEIAKLSRDAAVARLPVAPAYDDVWLARDLLCQRMHGCDAPRPAPKPVKVEAPSPVAEVVEKPAPAKGRK